MPQSSKAPPEPVTITNSEIMQAEVARMKKLLGLDINRLAIGEDIEGIIKGGPFGDVDYTVTGVNAIGFVKVSTIVVAGTQTNTTATVAPAPTNYSVIQDSAFVDPRTTLTSYWNEVIFSPIVTGYKIDWATNSLFTGASTITAPSEAGPPYIVDHGGLTPNTTYYFRISCINSVGQGPFSSTVIQATAP